MTPLDKTNAEMRIRKAIKAEADMLREEFVNDWPRKLFWLFIGMLLGCLIGALCGCSSTHPAPARKPAAAALTNHTARVQAEVANKQALTTATTAAMQKRADAPQFIGPPAVKLYTNAYEWAASALNSAGLESALTVRVGLTSIWSKTNPPIQSAFLWWTPSPDAVSYNVYQAGKGGNFTNITGTSATNLTVKLIIHPKGFYIAYGCTAGLLNWRTNLAGGPWIGTGTNLILVTNNDAIPDRYWRGSNGTSSTRGTVTNGPKVWIY